MIVPIGRSGASKYHHCASSWWLTLSGHLHHLSGHLHLLNLPQIGDRRQVFLLPSQRRLRDVLHTRGRRGCGTTPAPPWPRRVSARPSFATRRLGGARLSKEAPAKRRRSRRSANWQQKIAPTSKMPWTSRMPAQRPSIRLSKSRQAPQSLRDAEPVVGAYPPAEVAWLLAWPDWVGAAAHLKR